MDWMHRVASHTVVADKDYKAGDEIVLKNLEFNIQDDINRAIGARLSELRSKHEEDLSALKKQLDEAKSAKPGEGGVSPDDVKTQIEEAVKKVREESEAAVKKANADALRLKVIQSSGTKLPLEALAGFNVEIDEGEDKATERFKTFVEGLEKKFADAGFAANKPQGSPGNGGGAPGGDSDEALLAEYNKYYNPATSLTDAEKVRILKNKIDKGLHEKGKGPVRK